MSKISRSVYQKLKEENKRLLQDIKTLVMEESYNETIKVKAKWRQLFEEERSFQKLMHEYAKEYFKTATGPVADAVRKYKSNNQ